MLAARHTGGGGRSQEDRRDICADKTSYPEVLRGSVDIYVVNGCINCLDSNATSRPGRDRLAPPGAGHAGAIRCYRLLAHPGGIFLSPLFANFWKFHGVIYFLCCPSYLCHFKLDYSKTSNSTECHPNC